MLYIFICKEQVTNTFENVLQCFTSQEQREFLSWIWSGHNDMTASSNKDMKQTNRFKEYVLSHYSVSQQKKMYALPFRKRKYVKSDIGVILINRFLEQVFRPCSKTMRETLLISWTRATSSQTSFMNNIKKCDISRGFT